MGKAGDRAPQAVGQQVETGHLLPLHPFQPGLCVVLGVATELIRVAVGPAEEDGFDPVVFRGATKVLAGVLPASAMGYWKGANAPGGRPGNGADSGPSLHAPA